MHDLAGGFAATLRGVHRSWGVAMDNRVDVPGYKFFVDRASGERPPLFVAFLDLVEDEAAGPEVNGFCAPVTPAALAGLDRRERNYERVEVTERVTPARGRTWAYLGSAAGRERAQSGREAGALVVADSYLSAVEAGFERLGPDQLRGFRATSGPLPGPVRALDRVDLPRLP